MVKDSKRSWTRRSFLQLAGGAAFAAGAPGLLSRRVMADAAPIRIGHQCDLTGPLASTGYWRQKATDAAVAWLNENGGIAARRLEVVTVDTETKVDVGVRRMRQLVQEERVDFVIGSEHGGIAMASNPIALEHKTLYLSLSRTDNVTGKAANPYVFRLMPNTSMTAHAAGPWIIGNTGKRWAIIHSDYVWGESNRDAWAKQVKAAAGSVVQSVAIPVNTSDPLSHIASVDRSVDCIFLALLAPDMPRATAALRDLGYTDKHIVTADAVFAVFDILKLGRQVEGFWGMDSLPWELADRDTPHLRLMRKAAGLDEHGRELDSGRASVPGDIWPAWSNLGFLKINVEASGWKRRSDTEALVRHAEANARYAEGDLFPQGPLYVRPADHQAFSQYYAFRIEDGQIRTQKEMTNQAGIYPAPVDVSLS